MKDKNVKAQLQFAATEGRHLETGLVTRQSEPKITNWMCFYLVLLISFVRFVVLLMLCLRTGSNDEHNIPTRFSTI